VIVAHKGVGGFRLRVVCIVGHYGVNAANTPGFGRGPITLSVWRADFGTSKSKEASVLSEVPKLVHSELRRMVRMDTLSRERAAQRFECVH
jgi:hypothetical protein